MTLKLLLADDDAMVRAGLKAVLDSEHDLEVVGEAADGREAVVAAAELGPDVVIMDIRMPQLDGLSATSQIVAAGGAAPRVLVLTTFELDEYVFGPTATGFGQHGWLMVEVLRLAELLPGGLTRPMCCLRCGEARCNHHGSTATSASLTARPTPSWWRRSTSIVTRRRAVSGSPSTGLRSKAGARSATAENATSQPPPQRL